MKKLLLCLASALSIAVCASPIFAATGDIRYSQAATNGQFYGNVWNGTGVLYIDSTGVTSTVAAINPIVTNTGVTAMTNGGSYAITLTNGSTYNGNTILTNNGSGTLTLGSPVFVAVNFNDGGTFTGLERGRMGISVDGVTYSLIGGIDLYAPPLGGFRDPSMLKINGVYYTIYSVMLTNGAGTNYFGEAQSTNLVQWSFVTNVVPAAAGPLYAPSWITDAGGTNWASFFDVSNNVCIIQNNFTNPALWGSTNISVTLTNGSNVTGIDPFIKLVGSTYHLWWRSGDSLLHHATSLSISNNFTDLGALSFSASGDESPHVFTGPDGNYWMYFNKQNVGYAYATSPDLTNWILKTNVLYPPCDLGNTGWNHGSVTRITNTDDLKIALSAAAESPSTSVHGSMLSYGSGAVGQSFSIAADESVSSLLPILDLGFFTTALHPGIPFLGSDGVNVQLSGGTNVGASLGIGATGPLNLAGSSINAAGPVVCNTNVSASGNIGANGTVSANAANIVSQTALNPGVFAYNTGGFLYGFNVGYNAGTGYFTRILAAGNGNNSVGFSTAATGPTNNASYTDRMFVTPTGVLVATNSSDGVNALQVNGTIKAFGNILSTGTVLISSGANTSAGTVTLVAGQGTVTSTAITTNSVIFTSLKTAGGTETFPPLVTVGTGTATFSANTLDTGTYNWISLIKN